MGGRDVDSRDDEVEDVRDDETTRAAGTTAAGLPRRTPSVPHDGFRGGPAADTPRADSRVVDTSSIDTTIVEELLTRLANTERAREQAEAARDEAVQRADALAAALEDARAQPAETFGMRADKVLRMADHDAAQRRRTAEREAEELREQARADAEWITTEARSQASRITAEAQTRAQRVTADAAAEVDRLNAAGVAARRDGELVADTAASMHAHVSGLRSSVRDEVARLHALLGAELHRLDRPAPLTGEGGEAGRVADGLVGDTGPLPAVAARPQPAPPAPDDPVPAAEEPSGAGPDTGDLPAVSLPEQRAADGGAGTGGPADSGAGGSGTGGIGAGGSRAGDSGAGGGGAGGGAAEDGPSEVATPDADARTGAEPVRTSGHTGEE
ncbi:FoF1-type ATP synthase, membrane subunit b or b' [Pseudonocardia ammonioxydans]|uniref:FoF1-type ATP synthase, membrane subunit b or b n=1 Tax=Pseudonocardia ammonioxydans TaxID=260086 RepID=A0A1I4W098_PSUAM|nr:FoF1-type ATP synthase, membrane subunit b or b' [Pseudonocardia ammonioxydans]